MPTKVILIRHGETSWNVERRYMGHADVRLNERGIEQAKLTGRRFLGEDIHKVYSSDSRRASEFAKTAFKDHAVEEVPALREMNFGVFEGLTYDEVMRKYSAVHDQWLKDPFNNIIPEGERLKNFRDRIVGMVKRLARLNRDSTLAIVTHAGPIRILIAHILRSKDVWGIAADLASVNIVSFEGKKARVILLNDTEHLENG